jgi:acyl dehydratase
MAEAGGRTAAEAMTVENLDSPPSLPVLYAKVAAGALLPGRADALPERKLVLREAEVDLDPLASYARVCGFTLRDSLPPTYPHLLGFPLELALMSERSFPFRPLGVVHIANRIDQLRPIAVAGRPGVAVWAEGLRPHRRGRQFDLVTELEVDGEAAWREHSTYLRPGRDGAEDSGESERPPSPGDEPAGEAAAVWDVAGDTGRRYAEVSGDRNPIHLRAVTAKPFGFPGAIAHGMWMKARCLAALEGSLPNAFQARIDFRRPLRIPGRVRLRVGRREDGFDYALEPPDGGRPHVMGAVRHAVA